LPVPVIVVGNVIAGGAGKTPVVIALLEHLRARGLGPAWCRAATGAKARTASRSPPEAIRARSATSRCWWRALPVPGVRRGRPRRRGARPADAHPDVQVIVSDDGLQHHALQRDIEICVFDDRGVGNGWLLPAGPLREPWPRPWTSCCAAQARRASTASASNAHLADAARAPTARAAAAVVRRPGLHAVAGIASPEAFFSMLRDAGITLAHAIALPDHHDFTAAAAFVPPGRPCCAPRRTR
jgi:tetraacyldisaccharide 4'-kinase